VEVQVLKVMMVEEEQLDMAVLKDIKDLEVLVVTLDLGDPQVIQEVVVDKEDKVLEEDKDLQDTEVLKEDKVVKALSVIKDLQEQQQVLLAQVV